MKLKQILKYIILGLFVLNLPTVALSTFGGAAGSLVSYGSFFLLIVYYLFFLKGKPNFGLVLVGILYFTFGAFQLMGDERAFFTNFAKFLILVIFGSSFFNEVSKKEMRYVLAIGALSIILNAFFFENQRGRSGGFYINPNAAGFVVLFGYAICNDMKSGKPKVILQLLFTIAGFLTFSRTFLIIWSLINLISIRSNRKNFRILAVGVITFVTLLLIGSALDIGGTRFDRYKGVLNNETTSEELSHDSRTATWALFYDSVIENPLLGKGYGSFQGGGVKNVGAHNTYLLIIGESGIIPFLVFVIFLISLLKKSWSLFYRDPSLLFMSLIFSIYMLTTHNYFDNEVKVALSLFFINLIYKTELTPRQKEFQKKELKQ